jgi:hypothetical protein
MKEAEVNIVDVLSIRIKIEYLYWLKGTEVTRKGLR